MRNKSLKIGKQNLETGKFYIFKDPFKIEYESALGYHNLTDLFDGWVSNSWNKSVDISSDDAFLLVDVSEVFESDTMNEDGSNKRLTKLVPLQVLTKHGQLLWMIQIASIRELMIKRAIL